MFSAFPVVMYRCVCGSTSGVTRNAIRATRRSRAATRSIVSSSASDSTVRKRIRLRSAAAISSSVFPTPAKTIFSGPTPVARARRSSPPETMSKPAPAFARVFSTARFAHDFTE